MQLNNSPQHTQAAATWLVNAALCIHHVAFNLLIVRFGHAVMRMWIPYADEKFDNISIPRSWTFGSPDSVEAIFGKLAPLAPERTEILDCISAWMSGLIDRAISDPKNSLLFGFQSALVALKLIKREQLEMLQSLEELQEKE